VPKSPHEESTTYGDNFLQSCNVPVGTFVTYIGPSGGATPQAGYATKELVTFPHLHRQRATGGRPVPRRQSETLTEAELRIMNVLWLKGLGTVQLILDSLSEKPALAYNSVLTTIRVLERKGYVEHSKDGRAHVYAPLVGREEATRSEIRHLVGRFFRNSHEQLVLNILEDRGIEAEELSRLREMLERSGAK
jgi:BlaI family penicillinase repressor